MIHTAKIVVLDKTDLFQTKILESDVSFRETFPHYTYGTDYREALEFIKEMLLQRARYGQRESDIHFETQSLIRRFNIDRLYGLLQYMITLYVIFYVFLGYHATTF